MKWYYADAGKPAGPVEESVLDELAASGKVSGDTLVWHEGMVSWQPLQDVRGLGVSGAGRVRYAGFWIRFLARVIDALLLSVVNLVIRIPLVVLLGLGTNWRMDVLRWPAAVSLMVLSAILSIGIGVLYEAYFVSTRGGTLGKLALGIRIVRPGGAPVPASVAVGRYFAQWLSAAILLIGYLMAAVDLEKRALHDRICQTRVVYAH